jgi:hypothetical protein
MSMYAVLSVSREIPSASTPMRLAGFEEQIDPELVALPNPPRRRRALMLVVLLLAAMAALAMIFAIRHDIRYALANRTPADLGDLRTADARELQTYENRLVRAEATLTLASGIRYERLLSTGTFHTIPVAGRQDIWVEVRIPPGEEASRPEAPRQVVGRLVRLDGAGPRRGGLASAIEHATHERIATAAWLLIDGENPSDARWALLLALAFLGFAIWHIAATARMIRKVPG